MNGVNIITALREGLANPIVSFLQKGFGYTPVEGEYTYWLTWPVQTLSANASSGEIGVTISQDAGFLWEALVGTSTGAYTLRIREGGKEITFMNQPVTNEMAVGTAQRPGYPTLKPYWFRPNTTVTIDFTDLSGDSNTVRLAMTGRRTKTDPGAFRYTQGPAARMA